MNEVTLFVVFLNLVKEHCRKESRIEFYAGRLGVEPGHLTQIIYEKSDSNLPEWIETMKNIQPQVQAA